MKEQEKKLSFGRFATFLVTFVAVAFLLSQAAFADTSSATASGDAGTGDVTTNGESTPDSNSDETGLDSSAVEAGANTDIVAMYRLYNPNSGEHFYTPSMEERTNVVAAGWRYEGIGWYAPKSGEPVYRLYNPNAGDHHYTMSSAEKGSLVLVGWRYEGIGWYSDTAHTNPIYREYNPNATSGAHNFTGSLVENQNLVNAGWRYEGIAWYGSSTPVGKKWVPEQGHYEDDTEWVPNIVTIVDEPEHTETYDVYEMYWYNTGQWEETTDPNRFEEWTKDKDGGQLYPLLHPYAKAEDNPLFISRDAEGRVTMENDHAIIGPYYKTIPAKTHTEDHGSYQVTGKKWVVDVPGHWE